jgi:guanyl-specific ribonuclease Sa
MAGLLFASMTFAAGFSEWSAINPMIAKVPKSVATVTANNGDTQKIKIVNFGKLVYTGPVNVKRTLDRIRANSKLSSNNDGSVFSNNEKFLPTAPANYYREFVVWPAKITSDKPYGITFPGPMRLVIGKNGETYFTGDHYSTFQSVK